MYHDLRLKSCYNDGHKRVLRLGLARTTSVSLLAFYRPIQVIEMTWVQNLCKKRHDGCASPNGPWAKTMCVQGDDQVSPCRLPAGVLRQYTLTAMPKFCRGIVAVAHACQYTCEQSQRAHDLYKNFLVYAKFGITKYNSPVFNQFFF